MYRTMILTWCLDFRDSEKPKSWKSNSGLEPFSVFDVSSDYCPSPHFKGNILLCLWVALVTKQKVSWARRFIIPFSRDQLFRHCSVERDRIPCTPIHGTNNFLICLDEGCSSSEYGNRMLHSNSRTGKYSQLHWHLVPTKFTNHRHRWCTGRLSRLQCCPGTIENIIFSIIYPHRQHYVFLVRCWSLVVAVRQPWFAGHSGDGWHVGTCLRNHASSLALGIADRPSNSIAEGTLGMMELRASL